jgi:dihydroneopterin triphosphate diphosphatase
MVEYALQGTTFKVEPGSVQIGMNLRAMPKIVSDVVDTYVFRTVNARVQFLVVRRHPDVVMGDTWQSIHGKITNDETALDAARREILERTGIEPDQMYTADYISQFYDHITDTIVLAPTFAARVPATSRPRLSSEYSDYAWCDLEETTGRLMWNAQRWAVRHIYDVIAMSGEEAEMYAL